VPQCVEYIAKMTQL